MAKLLTALKADRHGHRDSIATAYAPARPAICAGMISI
jgi:hypothetical protein